MIRNLIFDFGEVLVHFDPDEIMKHTIPDPDDRKIVGDFVFAHEHWHPIDTGDTTEEELAALTAEHMPERLREPAKQVVLTWYRHLQPIPEMWSFVRRMKRGFGFSVYLLSNISAGIAPHLDLYPILGEMDGHVLSGVVKMVKPDRNIFDYTLRKFGLKAGETVLIDDSEKNFVAASSMGLRPYRFDGDVARLEAWLRELVQEEKNR